VDRDVGRGVGEREVGLWLGSGLGIERDFF
jgi:hypothetical protein